MKLQQVARTAHNGTPLYRGRNGNVIVWQTVTGTVHYINCGTMTLCSHNMDIPGVTSISKESLMIIYAVMLTETSS